MRLVASDLDGTLLAPGTALRVSPRVRTALRDVQARGIVVVLVTARNWRSVGEIAELAGVEGPAICSNGAVVFDLTTERVLHAATSPVDVVRDFVARCRSALADEVCFGWETAAGAYRDAAYHEAATATGVFDDVYTRAVEVVPAIADDHEVTKLLVRHRALDAEALLPLVDDLLGDGLTATISGGHFVEVMAAGITKAHALERLCGDLGIGPDEVVAVGDQPNDLPMLRWAGRGVAMGNAHGTVLAAVAEHAASNEEDGLALVLESLA